MIRSANALQVSGVDLLYADLSPFAESTRFGTAFLVTTFGFGICLTILVLAWVLDAPLLRWPAFLLGLVLVWGYPLSGHQATEPNSTPLTEVADWVHLVTAMLWVGGVLTLAVVVQPLAPDLRRRIPPLLAGRRQPVREPSRLGPSGSMVDRTACVAAPKWNCTTPVPMMSPPSASRSVTE